MNSKELESLCCIKNKLNERLMNETDETDIKKLRARLIKIQEDINKIENQRKSESKVQDFNNFYRQDEINRKIKELEPVLGHKQKEVDEAEFKLEKSKLELKRLLDKIETCENDNPVSIDIMLHRCYIDVIQCIPMRINVMLLASMQHRF
jgi:hypothetical protein